MESDCMLLSLAADSQAERLLLPSAHNLLFDKFKTDARQVSIVALSDHTQTKGEIANRLQPFKHF